MPTLAEAAANAQTPLQTALGAGLENISYEQEITFTKYVQVVLPQDGFVFWVKADTLSTSALFNFGGLNTAAFNQNTTLPASANTMTVKGSLHYSTDQRVDEAATFGPNRVLFTSETEIEDLMAVSPTVSYIGAFNGLRFQFSQRAHFYQQAGLHHYSGDAIYSMMESQIIDDPALLDVNNVVVSNSLPIWLTLTRFAPVYPSYLVPQNLPPPYIAVHVPPGGTVAIQPFANEDANSNQWQLCKDHVKFTLFGLRNYTAQDFLRYIYNVSKGEEATQFGQAASASFGIMGTPPVIRDERDPQIEVAAIAQKKTIELDVSYYQTRVRDVARQLILHAFCSLTVGNA